MTALVEIEQDQHWVTLWLNAPKTRNALSQQMIQELTLALDDVAQNDGIRGVCLRGRGGVFCSGGDLTEFQSYAGDMAFEEVVHQSMAIGTLLQKVKTLPKVTVALVEKAAMAGGMGLMCACDFAVADTSAKFALTEATLGIPPAQIAPYVIERIGRTKARQLMVTGAKIDAEEAEKLGLIDAITGHQESYLTALKADVKKCAPNAIAETKALLNAAVDYDARIRDAAHAFATCVKGAETKEGLAAFFEKRKPYWAA